MKIQCPSIKESSVQRLKEILKGMVERGENPPEVFAAPEIQTECNNMIQEYFMEKKVSKIDARQ